MIHGPLSFVKSVLRTETLPADVAIRLLLPLVLCRERSLSTKQEPTLSPQYSLASPTLPLHTVYRPQYTALCSPVYRPPLSRTTKRETKG